MFNPLGFASLSAIEAAMLPANRCSCPCDCKCGNPVTVTVIVNCTL